MDCILEKGAVVVMGGVIMVFNLVILLLKKPTLPPNRSSHILRVIPVPACHGNSTSRSVVDGSLAKDLLSTE